MKVTLDVGYEGYFECRICRLFWTYDMKVILDVGYEGYFGRRI
jgi:hypothetical protein